jgi:hypothetical protein
LLETEIAIHHGSVESFQMPSEQSAVLSDIIEHPEHSSKAAEQREG